MEEHELEEWCDIPGYEGRYQVSDLGRVRSLSRRVVFIRNGKTVTREGAGRILKPRAKPCGHLSMRLVHADGSKNVHALVLLAFKGPRPAGTEARHLDGNEQNNHLANLEYATQARNTQDRKWHKGSVTHVLKPADVLDIRRRLPTTQGVALAREYGVCDTTISRIRLGKAHRDCMP